MLQEIKCEKFIDKTIKFNKGLNSILGDNFSTNSIGKSTLLMIIDFVFAGSTFLKKDSGSINELGNLDFNFCFNFNNVISYYKRNTTNPDVIYNCDKNYDVVSEISTKKYSAILKENYGVENKYISFRDLVSLYSRVWGKDNYNVDKPLLSFTKEPDQTSILRLIKLFGFYNKIDETERELKNKQESKKFLNGAIKKNYIPKITKTTFNQNKIKIENNQKEIDDIKNNILKFTLNIEELSNKEVIQLKTEKSKLLDAQSKIQNKIKRLDLNLGKKRIKSRHLKRLSSFFENPNEKKISEIETFHNKISSILSRELETSKKILESENDVFQKKIKEIDIKISALLENVSSPKFIVDKIYDLTINSNKLINENKFYQEKIEVTASVKELEIDIDVIISDILIKIEKAINLELIRINKLIHSKNKKFPKIHLNRKSYNFDHSKNTGTGKSFADLIEFDLAILNLTDLPFLIHDSILFKNIEDFAVDKILEQYITIDKQIFIALDGVNKYNANSQNILKTQNVIELSESRKLFNRDWR